MSSSHERERQTVVPPPAPDVPRRVPRIQNQTNANGHHHPAVREIHKNAWLKRLSSSEKKGTPFVKKCDKSWVVFCVHDDVEAYLEFYTEPKMGAAHKPISAVSLNSCLHVSPSIIGQDNEYQFAVTLQNQVIRLVAANWDQMIEWVESLQGKLREMNILSPKDNLYSKLPESRGQGQGFGHYCTSTSLLLPLSAYGLGLVSTRDPNSPLPPTPNGFVSPVLGTEVPRVPVVSSNRGSSDDSSGGAYVENADRQTPAFSRSRNHSDGNVSHSSRRNGEQSNSGPNAESTQTSSIYVLPSTILNCSSSRDASCSGSDSGSGGSIDCSRICVPVPIVRRNNTVNVSVNVNISGVGNGHLDSAPPPIPVHCGTSTTTIVNGIQVGNNNSTVVTVGDEDKVILPNVSSSECSVNSGDSCSQSTNATNSNTSLSFSLHHKSGHGASSVNGSFSGNLISNTQIKSSAVASIGTNNCCISNVVTSGPHTESTVVLSSSPGGFNRLSVSSGPIQRSSSSENIYEHLFVPDSSAPPSTRSKTSNTQLNHSHTIRIASNSLNNSANVAPTSSKNCRSSTDEHTPPVIPRRNPQAKRLHKGNSSMSTRSSSLSRLESPSSSGSNSEPRIGEPANSAAHTNGTHHHSRHAHRQDVIRSFNGSAFQEIPNQFPVLQGRPMEAMIGVRSGEYRIRRDDNHVTGNTPLTVRTVETDCQTNSQSQSSQQTPVVNQAQTNGATHVPLKEQQVMRLRMEINHPGGVRVVLRKKDCVNCIAFVDFLGAVWIAGWKQQQHPVLYYAFHVGDQILKVAGVTVQTSVEANRAIKMVSSMQVEFIIRRLPFGRVLVLKRSKEGEALGLVGEGNSGEIGDVVPNGLAASHGLPRKGPSTDGHSTCNWFLTEINNRPLSLLARENEVKERLNAVGKEISILVQPADLIKHFKKNLKSMKGFKDYLVV